MIRLMNARSLPGAEAGGRGTFPADYTRMILFTDIYTRVHGVCAALLHSQNVVTLYH